ncbi:MAG: MOSC domain-containing protein [Acidimicrobiia bacterium]|nr:MOSC domain-containing protein [Acidimicrobiia bacterium]
MDVTTARSSTQPTTSELDAGLADVLASPSDDGTVEMIVSRPDVDERDVRDQADLAVGEGLVGDNYVARGNHRTDDGKAHPEAQITLMNSHSVDLVSAGDRSRWPLAGDQLFVDFDLSVANAPAGTRLQIGTAVLEVSEKPHTGCAKFRERFGVDAARWVYSRDDIRLRGINAMVVQAGTVRQSDTISKLG